MTRSELSNTAGAARIRTARKRARDMEVCERCFSKPGVRSKRGVFTCEECRERARVEEKARRARRKEEQNG